MLDVSKCQRGSSVLLRRNVCILWLQANIDDDARVVEMSSSLDQILMYLSIFQRQYQRTCQICICVRGSKAFQVEEEFKERY